MASSPGVSGELVWAELDLRALLLFGPRRAPVPDGEGVLAKKKLGGALPPASGGSPSKHYLKTVARRYRTSLPAKRTAPDVDRAAAARASRRRRGPGRVSFSRIVRAEGPRRRRGPGRVSFSRIVRAEGPRRRRGPGRVSFSRIVRAEGPRRRRGPGRVSFSRIVRGFRSVSGEGDVLRRAVLSADVHVAATRPRNVRTANVRLAGLMDPDGILAASGLAPPRRAPRPKNSSRKARLRAAAAQAAARKYPSLDSASAASTSATAVSLPRLPKGKSMTFRASVRAEIHSNGVGGGEAPRGRREWAS